MDPMKRGKKKRFKFVFKTALSHDAGYSISHIHTDALISYTEHMFDFMTTSAILPANIIASGFMGFPRQTRLSFLIIFSDLYRF